MSILQVRIVSAHRTPEMMYSYASSAQERGIQVIIAGAGGAAHLPGLKQKLCTTRLLHPIPTPVLPDIFHNMCLCDIS